MDFKNKKCIGDILAGVILLIAIKIPDILSKMADFAYIEDIEKIDIAKYCLTSVFVFVFFIYCAYFIRNIICGKYR